MFKNCYFNYAGQYSGKYNLIMAYVNRNEDFISGGVYEPITDSLSSMAETILYGLNHSESPLEFTVDIINPDDNIPIKQMQTIKEWLFGQDGWKKLTVQSFGYENIYLKCLLIPDMDIRDANGYVGVRCKVKNISGFWYGKDKIITYTEEDFNALTNNGQNVPENGRVLFYPKIETQCNEKIYPIIKFLSDDFNNCPMFDMKIHNEKTDYESDFSIRLDGGNLNTEFEVNCQYCICKASGSNIVPTLDTNYDFFYLQKGNNKISINVMNVYGIYAPPKYISFIYTPKVRVGGF